MTNTNCRGISIVEVVLSMTLLVLVLSSLAGVGLHVARQSNRNTESTYRDAALADEMDRVSVVPFDSLPLQTACWAVPLNRMPHQRCVIVTQISPDEFEIRVIVTPDNASVRSDTVRFVRSRPVPVNPFG